MGASSKTFVRLIDLKRNGLIGVGTKMIELGSQNISQTTGEELHSFISEFRDETNTVDIAELERIAAGGTMANLMKLCGVCYLALDIFEAENCLLFDLNTDSVPEDLRGQFDLVTNFGTSEHVIDQYRTFRTVHELSKPGGLIYHDVPMGGYFYHGYFSYTPLFFNHLASANGYDVLFRWFSKVPIDAPLAHQATAELTEAGWPDAGYHDIGIEYIFRKTTNDPFRLPVDVGTSLGINRQFLISRRSDLAILREDTSQAQLAEPLPVIPERGETAQATQAYDARLRALRNRLIVGDVIAVAEILEIERLNRSIEGQREFCLFLEKHALQKSLSDYPYRQDLASRLEQVRSKIAEKYACDPVVEQLLALAETDGCTNANNSIDKYTRGIALSYRAHCVLDNMAAFPPHEELRLIEFCLQRTEDDLIRFHLKSRQAHLRGQEDELGDKDAVSCLRAALAAAEQALIERDASIEAASDEVETLRAALDRRAREDDAERVERFAAMEGEVASLRAELAEVNDKLAERNATAKRAAAEVGALIIELAKERERSAGNREPSASG